MGSCSHPGVLVSTDRLAQNLNQRQIRIVEVDVDAAAYGQGYIPGVVAWSWKTELSGRRIQREITPWPRLKALLTRPGIGPATTIVIYGDNNNCRIGERSSHTWFVLQYLLGYKDVVNHDGSWTEWGIWLGRRSNVARRRRQRPEYSVAPV
jgi:3-mercaptopyruvate sulfurtransferase SseA